MLMGKLIFNRINLNFIINVFYKQNIKSLKQKLLVYALLSMQFEFNFLFSLLLHRDDLKDD